MPRPSIPCIPLTEEVKAAYRSLVKNFLEDKNTTAESRFRIYAFLEMGRDYKMYRDSPYKYIREVLKKKLVPKQIELVQAVAKSNRVLFRGSQYYGASFLAAALTNWFFDAFAPSVTLVVAPTEDLLVDVLWTEIRMQRRARPGLSPKAPRLEMNFGHYAQGLTAKDISAFEPRRDANLLIIFDRAHDIPEEFWKKAESVLSGENVKFVAFYRPTKEARFIAAFEKNSQVIEAGALEHPNIELELEHKPPQIEGAVRLAWLEYMLAEYAVETGDTDEGFNIKWQDKWYRPEPEFESNVLARWPMRARDSGYNLNPAIATPESASEVVPVDYENMIGEILNRAKEITSA